jgi:signal transduction histidine kinase
MEESLFHLFANAPLSIWYEDYSEVGAWMEGLRSAGVSDLEGYLESNPHLVSEAVERIRILDVNETSLRVFGAASRKELLAGLPVILAGEESRRAFIRELLCIWEGRHEFDCEFTAQTLRGNRVSYLLHMAIPVEDGKLDLSRVVIAISDISRLKAAEEERAKLEDQLKRAEKLEAVGRLAGGIAHDFNNMLTVILGATELAQCRMQEDRVCLELLDQITSAVARSRDTISRLLVFAKQQVASPTSVDLASVLQELERGLLRLVGEDITARVICEDGLWRVRADRAQIEQAIFNLVLNARDAMPDGGQLTIEASNVEIDEQARNRDTEMPPGEYVRLAIADTGCGMSATDLARVFEPFFTTKENGTGLGLATVYGTVRQANGFILATSAPGRGTAFVIHLPRCHTLAPIARKRSSQEEGHIASGRILVVEDEAMLLNVTTQMLLSFGYTVFSARSAEDALRICEQTPIDLLLTDVVMPGMNGKQLRDRVVGMRPGTKAIYMSGYARDVLDALDVDAEGTSFIQKPFSAEALAGALAALLGER